MHPSFLRLIRAFRAIRGQISSARDWPIGPATQVILDKAPATKSNRAEGRGEIGNFCASFARAAIVFIVS
jgi:hypothetical protein